MAKLTQLTKGLLSPSVDLNVATAGGNHCDIIVIIKIIAINNKMIINNMITKMIINMIINKMIITKIIIRKI